MTHRAVQFWCSAPPPPPSRYPRRVFWSFKLRPNLESNQLGLYRTGFVKYTFPISMKPWELRITQTWSFKKASSLGIQALLTQTHVPPPPPTKKMNLGRPITSPSAFVSSCGERNQSCHILYSVYKHFHTV